MRLRPVGMAAALIFSACQGNDGIVRPDEPGKLVLEPSTVEVHSRQSFAVKASLPNGSPLLDSITWTTSDGRVASTIGDSVLPRAEGTATLTATVGDRTGTVKVTVVADVSVGGFQSPFLGDFPTANVFDHDLPNSFNLAPNNGYLLSHWGEKLGGVDGHNGYDWVMPTGTPIYSAAPGRVTFAGMEQPFNCRHLPNNPVVAGLWVVMAHGVYPNEYLLTQYGHFSSIQVKAGDQIPAGHLLGHSGGTGCSTVPHLHLTVARMRGTESVPRDGNLTILPMDPYGWLGSGLDPWAADTAGIESVVLWNPAKAPKLYGPGPIGWTPNTNVVAYSVNAWGVRDTLYPNNEFVDLTTTGAGADLTGWSLRNAAGDHFEFPAGTKIPPGNTGMVRVYSGAGGTSGQMLYWGRTAPAWNNLGDCLQIFDAVGNRVSYVSLMNYNKCAELGLSVSALRRSSAPLDYPAPMTSTPDRRED